jgi:hypothetical protein
MLTKSYQKILKAHFTDISQVTTMDGAINLNYTFDAAIALIYALPAAHLFILLRSM